jgi:hypothetical protein
MPLADDRQKPPSPPGRIMAGAMLQGVEIVLRTCIKGR